MYQISTYRDLLSWVLLHWESLLWDSVYWDSIFEDSLYHVFYMGNSLRLVSIQWTTLKMMSRAHGLLVRGWKEGVGGLLGDFLPGHSESLLLLFIQFLNHLLDLLLVGLHTHTS